jgi:hypothetical protein
MDAERDRHGHVRPGDLLHDHGPGAVGETGPTDRLRERRRGEAERAHAREEGAVEAFSLVALGCSGQQLPSREVPGRLAQEHLLRRERERLAGSGRHHLGGRG